MPFPLLLAGAGASLLGGLLGGGGKKAPSAGDLSKMFGANALSGDTMKLYQLLSQSPQFKNLLTQNSVTGAQFGNDLSAGLAQRGLSTSGIGTIAGAAGRSAVSTGESSLRGGLFGTAGNLAQQNLLARLSAFSGMQSQQIGQPSFGSQISGDVLASLMPLLFKQGQMKNG